MSIHLMNTLAGKKVGSSTRKLILNYLCDAANEQGYCWPSYQRLADKCEMDRSTVIRHVNALVKAGALERYHQHRTVGGRTYQTSNVFRIRLDGLPDLPVRKVDPDESCPFVPDRSPPVVADNDPPVADADPVVGQNHSGDAPEPPRGLSPTPHPVVERDAGGSHAPPRTISRTTIEPSREPSVNPTPASARGAFVVPTLAEVAEYIRQQHLAIDPARWWHYQNSRGWRVGASPMKNWKSAVQTWARDLPVVPHGPPPLRGGRKTRDVPLDEQLGDRSWAEPVGRRG